MDEFIQTCEDLQAAGTRMIEIANERGGEDNITVIVAQFAGADLRETTQSKRITGSYNAFEKTISYEEAAFIASRYVPPDGQTEETDEQSRAPVTGVLRMPANYAAEEGGYAGAYALDGNAAQSQEFFARQSVFNRRRNLMMWIIALVMFLLLAVAGYFFVKPRFEKRNPPPPPPESVGKLDGNDSSPHI